MADSPTSVAPKPSVSSSARGWVTPAIVAGCVGVVGVVVVYAPAPIGDAAKAMVVRVLSAITLKVLLGVFAAVLARRLWADAGAFSLKPEHRFGVTRHWGGLGSGEGGWEVEPTTVQWGARVVAALGMAVVAFVLLASSVAEPNDAMPVDGSAESKKGAPKPAASASAAPARAVASASSAASPCAPCGCVVCGAAAVAPTVTAMGGSPTSGGASSAPAVVASGGTATRER